MDIQENVSLKPKTTMRIGGTAQFFAEPASKADVEAAWKFAQERGIPLIVLGGGSNTIFADETIQALVVRLKNEELSVKENTVSVGSGKNLPMLINELAEQNLDLSPLTGILGSVGGAIFGNAGQGPKGIWIDTYVESVEVFVNGEWKVFSKNECHFTYRESVFKEMDMPVIIWNTTLQIPTKPAVEIKAEVQRLLQKRIETQPHVKTAGSCFKAVGETPAWQLIDAVGLRGKKIGGVTIAEKHANFLLNDGTGTFADAKAIVEEVKQKIEEPLSVEMRFIQNDGSLLY